MMRYTKHNMEPKPLIMHDMFEPALAKAIGSKDVPATKACLEQLVSQESVVAEWTAALGTRLKIRDLLLAQKGNLAALLNNPPLHIPQGVTEYIKGFDGGLSDISGWNPETNETRPVQELKQDRINRLGREKDDSLFRILTSFAGEEPDKVVGADALVNRLNDIRNGVVERLWSAAQTYNEGNAATAMRELQQEGTAVIHDFDMLTGAVLKSGE